MLMMVTMKLKTPVVLLLCMLLGLAVVADANLEDDIDRIIDEWWIKINKTEIIPGIYYVDQGHLEDWFIRYNSQDGEVDVYESHHATGTFNFALDVGIGEEDARASFKNLDLLVTDDEQRIDVFDIIQMINYGDFSGDGTLDEDEFTAGMNGVLFSLGINRWYVDYRNETNPTDYADVIFADRFMDTYRDMDTDADQEVQLQEFTDFFGQRGYANSDTAMQFFYKVDLLISSIPDDVIYEEDWLELYANLDSDVSGYLDIFEWETLIYFIFTDPGL